MKLQMHENSLKIQILFVLYLNLSLLELLLDPVPIELVSAWYPLEPLLKPLTSDSLFELLLDPVPIELVLAWYPLGPELKLLTSDSLFVKSKSNPNGGKTLLFTNVWTAGSCFGNGDKTLWGSMKVSGIILK